jgi:acetyl-CoA C-acetyltransferase
MANAFIVDAVRTAGGRRNGKLAAWHPADLAAQVLNALLARTGIDPNSIEDVILGCVTQAGEQGFAFARNAVLASRLPESVPAVTIDRQCGSSQQSVQFAAQAVLSGTQDVVIAAGAESMTRVPMFSNLTLHEKAGIGTGPVSAKIAERYGVKEFSQFQGAEMIATKYGLDRETLDRFALQSHQRAASATRSNAFQQEIVAVPIVTADGTTEHVRDEGIRYDASMESLGSLKLLREGGVISAGNASQICDGASAALIVSERALKTHGLTPLARIHTFLVTAGDPVIMLEEPIRATTKALDKAGLKLDDIDLFEVNEAFASVPLAWLQALHADPDKLNVKGGAIALGHPLGASGTKLLATLAHALKARNQRYGLQVMCEGGGLANVTIIEAMQGALST